MSFVAHVIVIGAWAVGTFPNDALPADSLANRVYYLPPPDRAPRVYGTRETVRYVAFGDGKATGPTPSDVDARRPPTLIEHVIEPAPAAVDSEPTKPLEPPGNTADSIFTVLEVDSAAVRSQSSAAPAYPLDLLTKHIEGVVTARYVVDTTGFADVGSFDVVGATNPGFVNAVRDALPYMRFSPAKIGQHKVRQLVEQSFSFRIAPPQNGNAIQP